MEWNLLPVYCTKTTWTDSICFDVPSTSKWFSDGYWNDEYPGKFDFRWSEQNLKILWNIFKTVDHLKHVDAGSVWLHKPVINFYLFEKWTYQQMLINSKCFFWKLEPLNKSQKCPPPPLDDKLSALPSTPWHWHRCPSLSNGVQGLPWSLTKLAKKALGYSNLREPGLNLNERRVPFDLDVLSFFIC